MSCIGTLANTCLDLQKAKQHSTFFLIKRYHNQSYTSEMEIQGWQVAFML